MQMPGPGPTLTRTYAIGLAAALLLAVTVGLGWYLGQQTRAQFREIDASWADYSGDARQKGEWISAIRGHLGYGGIIHHFKNYVLRQDPRYLDRARLQLTEFNRVAARFLQDPLSAEERAALETIVATMGAYEARIEPAMRAAQDGWDAARTDRLVRVDDAAAIAALGDLERIWQDNQRRSTDRIVRAVGQGQTLIWVGFLSIFALMLAALTLGGLLLLLIRDMRRAAARLSAELEARRALQRSESRLAAAVEQSPTTIFITDTDARILYANARFERTTGWSRHEVEGLTPRFLQSGDTAPEVYADIRARLLGGRTWRGVFRNRRKDGGSYWAETTILPLIGPDGAVQNFIGLAEDVTEKRQAREQIARAQKLEAVGLLAGGIAHDFNNILTTIVGAAHLAAMDAPPGGEVAEELEQIDIAARRAQSLVRELLTFARREPGRPQPTDLRALIDEVLRLMRASAPPTVRFDHAPSHAVVMGDQTHLHQILMNLCRNAAEAIGGAPGVIRVDAGPVDPPPDMPAHPAGWVRLTVADDGPGMSDATLDHLFDPFFTTKPLGKGSGLGLAVVAGLVEELGGRIAVDSAPGAGTVFTVHLPGADARDVAAAPDAQDMPRGHERVILIDDEAEVAGVFRRVLARLGYQVEAFTSPSVALERFRRDPSRFDLVISDMVMPEMSGAELAAAMRATRPDLPVMFCSGYSPGDIVLDGPEAELLAKPVDPARLAVRVRAMLDGRAG